MGQNAKQIAARFLGAAQKNPEARAEIFRQAAYTFMGLSQNPKNARTANQLANIGLDFAGAAHRERPAVMDDFQDLLLETQTAYDEVGDDPMDLVSRRREIHDQRTPPDPGHISIAPSSFNKDATLGRSANIKFAPTNDEVAQGIQQSQGVAFWQGVKKEAQAMTVDISLGFLPTIPLNFGDSSTAISNRPYAEVEYGSDGNRTKVPFDLAFGNRCTVVGNYIAVTIGMNPPEKQFPSGDYYPTSVITAGASIGAFAAPSQAPLINTAYVDHLAATSDSDPIAIPLKAVQLLPVQSGLLAGETLSLRFYNYGGHLVSRTAYTQSATAWPQPIPITGDVAFVILRNESGTARSFRLPFQLGL